MSKKHPMSLSVDTALHEVLRTKAAAKKIPMSEFVRQLIGHFNLENPDIKAVVLQIPTETLSSRSALETWLATKSQTLVNQMFPTET